MSASYDSFQKWVKLVETPDGRTPLQLGKQVCGTEHVLAPVQTNQGRTRGKVHSLAYEVESAEVTSRGWQDVKQVWLESGLQNMSVLLKLVGTPSGDLAVSLGKFKQHSDSKEFATVSTAHEHNLQESLHELANLLG